MKKFVPDSVVIPSGIETNDFRLRRLMINDVVKDYDAVISSIDYLREVLVFGPGDPWPPIDLTLEQDLIDLGWHQREFQIRSSFTFTVISLDESKCLGCVYVYPSEKKAYDAKVMHWVRQSEVSKGLDNKLFIVITKWMTEKWWFSTVAFPGRQMSWEDWETLPDK